MAGDELRQGHSMRVDAPRRDWFFIGVALVITAVTYLGTLRFGFVYHDVERIAENPFIKSWRYLPQYFHGSIWARIYPQAPETYYRPLYWVWGLLNYSLFKARPFGWHLTTLLLYLIVTFLVYRVVRGMTRRPDLAWLTAVIFGVHPIHSESVAWISGSSESLFAALFLASFLAFLHFREHRRKFWIIVSCALYGLAMLAKGTAVILPLLVFAYAWTEGWTEGGESLAPVRSSRWHRLRGAVVVAAAYVPVAGLYLLLRIEALRGLNLTVSHVSAYTWLLTLPSILFFYLRHWFIPVNYSEFYDVFYQSRPNLAQVVVPALVLLVVVILAWKLRGRLGASEMGYAGMWILLPLLPALDMALVRPEDLVHDRYFYLPSIGAALLIALVVERVGRAGVRVFGRPFRMLVTGLALALVLALCAVRASSFWTGDYAMLTHAHQIAPNNLTVLNDLGVEWMLRGNIEQAQAILRQARRQSPGDWRAASNLGRAEYLNHDYPQAEQDLRRAIQLEPAVAAPYVTLGELRLKANRPEEALGDMRRAAQLNPYSPKLHAIYGVVLQINGDCPRAVIEFQDALRLDPNDNFAKRQMKRCQGSGNPGATSGKGSARD